MTQEMPTDAQPDHALETDAVARAVEATLFAAEEPMSLDALAAHLGDLDKTSVRDALVGLADHYSKRGVHLVERGKRWHFETAPDLTHLLRREKEQVRRLSRAATEVLAIIAYHEPVSRAEIESIRGVQTSAGTLDVLMEAGWTKLAGRREVPGRPVIYATTPEFLDHFGLSSRRDLPGIDELRATGLLDPVDDAFEEAMAMETPESGSENDGPENAEPEHAVPEASEPDRETTSDEAENCEPVSNENAENRE